MAIRFTRDEMIYRAHFYVSEEVKQLNGSVVDKPVEQFARNCGQYSGSAIFQHTIEGFNRMTDIIIAVPKVWKDPINSQMDVQLWTVTINDIRYDIKEISPAKQSDVMGYHLITIRRRSNNNVTNLT